MSIVTNERQHLRSLSCHILSPIDTALDTVKTEKKVIEAEIDAFDEFKQRVTGIDCDTESDPEFTPLTNTDSHSKLEEVRTAYRETVMATDHYETEYAESLEENLQQEFGPQITSNLTQPYLISFTPMLKEAITVATQESISTRLTIRSKLEDECNSLHTVRKEITDLLGSIERVRIPEWYRTEFIKEMDAIAAERQEHIGSHYTNSRLDSHDFFEYLYSSDPSCYPVLLSLGRFREAIIV